MKKTLTFNLVILASILVFSSSASAATANFQGQCNWAIGSHPKNLYCEFDALLPASNPSSCSPSSIDFYSWSFGDGTSASGAFLAYSPHTYLPTQQTHYQVRLTIFCKNGDFAVKGRGVDVAIGAGGIKINRGWN